MTAFGQPQIQAGHNFSIAYLIGADLPDVSADAARALTNARNMISRCYSLLKSRRNLRQSAAFATKYLGVEADEFNEEIIDILKDIKVLMEDSNRHVLLKITDVVMVDGLPRETTNGKVVLGGGPSKPGKAFPKNEIQFTSIEKRKNFHKEIHNSGYASNIHLKAESFRTHKDVMGVIIIHEMTHKFLGYHDGYKGRWYFGADGNDLPNLKKAPQSMLRRSADGMAWFIANVAGKIDRMEHMAINPSAAGCAACTLF